MPNGEKNLVLACCIKIFQINYKFIIIKQGKQVYFGTLLDCDLNTPGRILERCLSPYYD